MDSGTYEWTGDGRFDSGMFGNDGSAGADDVLVRRRVAENVSIQQGEAIALGGYCDRRNYRSFVTLGR
ncbi:MAG: hypothetical protein AAGD25_11770 [Cyanobacteria bacterium P01_F01_bin.150]